MKKNENDHNQITIRNSAAEFLVFSLQKGEDSIDVRVEDENVWLTQKLMGKLFNCTTENIIFHLKNIFKDGEQNESSVTKEYLVTALDGKNYATKHYNLEAIISVGYKVNSETAIQFRKWATNVLKEFSLKGYVLDKDRLKRGAIFTEQYYEDLLEDIREIRASERKFYQKITDIYATSFDYDKDSETTNLFFKTVQNRLHFAIHGMTAAEVIMDRASAKKEHMGLTTWNQAPHGKIRKSDVSIAKNYLSKDELSHLEHVVTMYLDYAELQVKKRIPMTMNDWAERLNVFLNFNEYDLLKNAGKVSAEVARAFAESEFEKYRVIQDGIFKSDFDIFIENVQKQAKKK